MSKKKKRRCRHTGRAIAIIGFDVEAYACRKCDAVGVRSLGRSNDDSPAVQIEIRAAEISACHGPRMNEAEARGYCQHPFDTDDTDHLPAWFAGWLASEMDLLLEEGESADAEAWPWDPKRPVAGQYEEHLARLHVAAKLSEPTSVLEQMRAAIDLDPVPNPNALAAMALTELDAQADREEARSAANTAALVADLDARGPAYDALMEAMDAEAQRAAEPDPRDEDRPEAERLLGETESPQRDPKHCDDYINDESAPAALRAYLARARSPGHGMLTSDPFPRLFADYEGKRVRVVMASRLGDVGITADLAADITYQKRVAVEDLANFGDAP